LTKNLKHFVVDRRIALVLLYRLCEMASDPNLDYDSARQISWSFRVIYEESKAIDPKSIPDPDIPKILNTLGKRLELTLPSAGRQEPIEKTLAMRLRAVAEYDPRLFWADFAELAKRLPVK